MVEGMLGGTRGEEEEKPEVEAPEAPAGVDAFAAAIAHHASIQNPEVAHDASAFLRGQLHHVEVQTKHLEEEHGLRIAHLRNQLAEERVRRLSLRLRVGFQLFVVLVATAIGLGLIVLAPSYPASYYSWGLALEKHKDLKGAAEEFRVANLKGPTWADPLKSWGDVLMDLGKPKEALAKYDEALKYAPNWKQLKEAREAAAKQKS